MEVFAKDVQVGNIVVLPNRAEMGMVVAVGEDTQGERVIVAQYADLTTKTGVYGPFAPITIWG